MISSEITAYISTINLKSIKVTRLNFSAQAAVIQYFTAKTILMVRLFYTDDKGEDSTVIFSAVFGENATFQISEKRKQSYGEMISKFKDPEWYLNE